MSDDRAPWEPAAVEDLAELRELILGPERRRLRELERRLDAAGVTREELAELLPEAIVLRAARDRQLARALAPTVESAIGESVRRNPREIATAIFPVLGPAIRKAIAEALAGLVASINSALEHNLSPRGLKWRLEAWRTRVPYAQIVLKHALVYRVEQVFLVHAETGLLLAHAWAPELPVSDGDLISGMLTAIRDFVADSFARERDAGGLRRFSVGELTVMVEQGPQAVIAAVVRGQTPDTLLAKLQDTLERVHLEYSGPLTTFDGDATPFEPTRPLLEECLATVVSTDRARNGRRSVAWLPWVAGAVLVLGALIWFRMRSEQRWERAVARLESEPGIVVTHADREGGRWSFAGLRDPLAPDPSALLAAVAVDTTGVEQRWEPYLSLRPELVLARARKRLAPPATVALALAGDTLRLRGLAPLSWAAATARLAALPPGVAALDLSDVAPETPADLAKLEKDIEGQRVLFDVGSASLGRETRGTAARVAASFSRLEAGAAGIGARAALELIGRTDATGSDSTNQALSRVRAEAVLAVLAARGVNAGAARVSAAGTSQPLAGADPAEQARINRSVSFKVSLGWGSVRTGAVTMIQKKICMVGLFGTGKTSLVQRFVHTLFSERYLSTVGVKIDRKPMEIDGASLTLVLWDLAGRDGHEDITTSYLRGAHAILYVADGTRRESCDQLSELRALGREAAGDVPGVLALNKADLVDRWALGRRDEEALAGEWDMVRTSAKTGDGVEEVFRRLARGTLAIREARP